MDKIKIVTFTTNSNCNRIDKMRRLLYWASLINLLYKINLGKGKENESNRPLFKGIADTLIFWYNTWSIAPESVDELSGIRKR